MKIELVVFDVAGTTVVDDDAVLRSFRAALADERIQAEPQAIRAVMGLAKPVAIAELARGKVRDDELEGLVERAHTHFVDRMVGHYLSAPGIRPIPGAETTFHALREEGIRVALDTGFNRRILDAVLLRLGWLDDVVDSTVASDEVEHGRPHADMIRAQMRLHSVTRPARVVKVGDTPADMREGVAAACGHVVGVLSGTGTADDLLASGATSILADVAALPRLLFGRPSHLSHAPRETPRAAAT